MKHSSDVTPQSDAASPSEFARKGHVIAGRYRLEEPLERGAMGAVWRARHMLLKAPVAIKFLDATLVGDAEIHERFVQEARSAAAVRSAHVVQVLDYGEEAGIPFIVMELLEGENLDARLGRRGHLTFSEVHKIVVEVARAMSIAHAHGVVHRDLKPGNIFIAREGEDEVTKLVDFGIAKVSPEALDLSQIIGTQRGTLLGTPQYMSPEQIRGRSSVDHRTDLWALAIITCECLTGQCPFPGKSLGDLTVQICTERPIAPSLLGPVPPGFDDWFFKATHKRPSQRFASAREMAAAFARLIAYSEGGLAPSHGHAARRHFEDLSLGRAVRGAWTAAERQTWALVTAVRRVATHGLARVAALARWDRFRVGVASLRQYALLRDPMNSFTPERQRWFAAGLATLVIGIALWAAPPSGEEAPPPAGEVRVLHAKEAPPAQSAAAPAQREARVAARLPTTTVALQGEMARAPAARGREPAPVAEGRPASRSKPVARRQPSAKKVAVEPEEAIEEAARRILEGRVDEAEARRTPRKK